MLSISQATFLAAATVFRAASRTSYLVVILPAILVNVTAKLDLLDRESLKSSRSLGSIYINQKIHAERVEGDI
jgi:hypothetical protein